ncbi:MAG: hypothetical protein NT029_00635 [Armatimonadetes bacterium]|nr:hypothetical protein [Armatimonadota bacterium]
MRSVTVQRSERKLTSLLKLAHGENILLTAPDGREYLLAELDAFDQEIDLLRGNDEFMQLLSTRSREPATVSLDDARRQLGL